MLRKKKAVTIQDVAAEAGVSVSTVSRVLNDKDDVSPATQLRVREVIDELGYASSLAARSMRSRKTNVVGMILPDMEQAFSIEVIRGVSRATKDYGYDLITFTGGENSNGDRAGWEQHQVSLLNGSIADGIIVVTPNANTFRTPYPLVAVDPHSQSADYPSVISTNRLGMLAGLNYLTSLGHRRIGFIGGRPDLKSSERRMEGYKDALQQAGVGFDPALVLSGDYSRKSGYRCTQQLLSLANPVSAIVGANDDTALGAMDAIAERGLRVPEDISILGFDNVPQAAYANPPLSTVDQSIVQMGYAATEMLLKLIDGKELETNLCKVQTRLIIRNSCRAVTNELVELL